MTTMNSPNVSTITHADARNASGRTSVFTSANSAVAATSEGTSSIWMPGTRMAASHSPTALTTSRSSSSCSDGGRRSRGPPITTMRIAGASPLLAGYSEAMSTGRPSDQLRHVASMTSM